jgi:hypothetical protein
MFSPRTLVPTDQSTVTIPNGPAQVSTMAQVMQDAPFVSLGGAAHLILIRRAAPFV